MELTCVECGSAFTRQSKAGPIPRFCRTRECLASRQSAATKRWAARNPERAAELRRANTERFKAANPARRREWELARKFNITPERYAAMLAEQAGVCAICRQPETSIMRGRVLPLAVDHDHDTGLPRGLLCGACNRGIGMLRDNATLLRVAADYIEASHGC